MPVKEKRVISLRYIWRIFAYTLDISFIITGLSAAQLLYKMSDVQIMNQFVRELTGERILFSDMWYAKWIALIGAAAALGLLLTLRRLISHELSTREDTERLLFALGYRKKNIILYEEGYVMFDLCCAYIAASVITSITGIVLISRIHVLAVFCSNLGRLNCMTWEAYLVTALILVLVIGSGTAFEGPYSLLCKKERNIVGGSYAEKKSTFKKEKYYNTCHTAVDIFFD